MKKGAGSTLKKEAFAHWTATELACLTYFTGRQLYYYKTSCQKEGKVIVKERMPADVKLYS